MECFQTIVDAWNWLKVNCLDGYRQDTQRGSFAREEGVHRMQALPTAFFIVYPRNFLHLPKEVTLGSIELYFHDLLDPTRSPYSTYTYGARMWMLDSLIGMLRDTPHTNQACITIARPEDVASEDPPCLRELQFMYIDGLLHMSMVFRSNDIGEAFLYNLGGFALLQEVIAEAADLAPGGIYYYCVGPHVYVRRKSND